MRDANLLGGAMFDRRAGGAGETVFPAGFGAALRGEACDGPAERSRGPQSVALAEEETQALSRPPEARISRQHLGIGLHHRGERAARIDNRLPAGP
jgi:hypothetical protein